MLDGGSHVNGEEKPTISESKAVILAVFCSFLICVILFLVLWFSRTLEHCDNSFLVSVQGSAFLFYKPYPQIVLKGSNSPVRFVIQALGHKLSMEYDICRLDDLGNDVCFARKAENQDIIMDHFLEVYDEDPCREDNATGLWINIKSVSPSPVVVTYCFSSDENFAATCLQAAKAPPLPERVATPSSESSKHKRNAETALTKQDSSSSKKFYFVGTSFSAKPDWNQFLTSYSWDPLDGYLPQYLPLNAQFAFCAQTLNFRKLALSYRSCYNDISTTPGIVKRKCSQWTDIDPEKPRWFINDTLLFMPTAQEGSIVIQIQAAEGPFVAAVGVKPDIDEVCGTDGSGDDFIQHTEPVSSPPPPPPPPPPSPPTPPAKAPPKAPPKSSH